ncbi:hypothetical protein [Methylobacterium komagatae]
MRHLLLFSLIAAIVAVGAVAYQFMPRGSRAPQVTQQQNATTPPVRSIPMRPGDAGNPAPAPTGGGVAKSPDVLGDVSKTLEELRTRDTADSAAGPALNPTQVDALRAQAERRHVRPVTRMTFALEPGTTIPQQVYLHPLPPELAGLSQASDPLGFCQVGDRFVLVGTVSRRIIAVSKS